jgi:hypothetical protein
MALIFIFAGLLGAAFTLGVYAIRTVRNVETIMPDHDAQKPATEPSTAT